MGYLKKSMLVPDTTKWGVVYELEPTAFMISASSGLIPHYMLVKSQTHARKDFIISLD